MQLTEAQIDEIKECLEYIHGVGPGGNTWKRIMAGYGQSYTNQGDDLCGQIWHIERLRVIFGLLSEEAFQKANAGDEIENEPCPTCGTLTKS